MLIITSEEPEHHLEYLRVKILSSPWFTKAKIKIIDEKEKQIRSPITISEETNVNESS